MLDGVCLCGDVCFSVNVEHVHVQVCARLTVGTREYPVFVVDGKSLMKTIEKSG